MTSFFINGDALTSRNESYGDTIADVRTLTNIEKQNYEKLHYGLNTVQLQTVFPELVYEKEDGSYGVNYIEMIPILVQTINELNNKIKELEVAQAHELAAEDALRIVVLDEGNVEARQGQVVECNEEEYCGHAHEDEHARIPQLLLQRTLGAVRRNGSRIDG